MKQITEILTKHRTVNRIIRACILIVFSCMTYLMIFFSALPKISLFFAQDFFWMGVNIVLILSGILILNALTGKMRMSLLIASAVSFVWSAADYFTVMYHGSPLFPNEYANFRTALEVAGNYSFSIDNDLLKLICAFAALVVLAVIAGILEGNRETGNVKRTFKQRMLVLALGAAGAGAAAFIVLGPLQIKPETTMGWSWKSGVEKYGLLVCGMEDMRSHMSDPYKMPEGYSPERLSGLTDGKAAASAEKPDVIVILNETFFDLERFYEIEPDISPMEKFYGIDNAVYGFAPAGSGTNDSEYELLMSNSLMLLNATAPFNYLDLKGQFSIVRYMEALGYTTTGMHCGEKANYHRNSAYRDLGFDNIRLGTNDFTYRESNYNRSWLDSGNYKDMLDYLDANTSGPQFVFLLTYQNHGGYEQNDDSLDTVHVGADYGDMTGQLNEFMSSLKLSADAFYDLTEELKGRRPTAVLMVGDHGPGFAPSLKVRDRDNGYDEELSGSLVPYVIWTNYMEVPQAYGEYASMEDLVPMLLDTAGLPISAYYNKLLELHEAVPLRNPGGMYIDSNGNIGSYSEASGYYELFNEYLYMEYSALSEEETSEELFMPPTS